MRTFLLSVASVLLFGCSTNIDMTLPVGPEGPAGKDGMSAYELWVEAVENGIIEWDEETDLPGFFRYLKGEKGDKGDDGTNGKDAYELWKEMVADGIEDPHNPPNLWDENETDKDDFFRFLTGKDGLPGDDGSVITIGSNGNWFIDGVDTGIQAEGEDGEDGSIVTIGNNGNWLINGVDTGIPATGASGLSAWQLWIEDVQDEDGLEDPHKDDGSLWDTDEVGLDDFWRYLRGRDGEDGISPTIPIVDPGEPGSDFTPIIGKPNVIAEYTQKAYSEYVSTTDGSVTYQVYLDNGSKAGVGLTVTDMPGGLSGPYTTLSDGTFKVPKKDLPTSGSVEERYGSAKVNGISTAANTYVPQKIDVRLMIGYGTHTVPTLTGRDNTDSPSGGVYMSVPVRAQRRVVSEGEWEDLPGYLPNIDRTVHAYEIDLDSDDPAAPNMAKKWKFHSSDTPISLTGATVGVRRPTVRVQWMPEQTQIDDYFLLEDDMTTAFTMVLDDATGLYGEKPATRDVLMYAPVNFHPLPKNLVMNDFNPLVGTNGVLTWRSGSFDVNTDLGTGNIVNDFLFATNYYVIANAPAVGDVEAYKVWNPNDTTRPNINCLGIGFRVPGEITVVGTSNMSSIGDPDYTVNNQAVYIGSDVFLRTTSLLVAGPGLEVKIGTLIEKPASSGQYVIEAMSPFTFDDIPIYADANLIPMP